MIVTLAEKAFNEFLEAARKSLDLVHALLWSRVEVLWSEAMQFLFGCVVKRNKIAYLRAAASALAIACSSSGRKPEASTSSTFS
jgi:hypothetical protein